MKLKASGISFFSAALFVALFIIMAAVIGLAIVWALLHIGTGLLFRLGLTLRSPLISRP